MIVLDEQLSDARIVAAIERWYRGKVISILEVRPHTRVLDDVIGVTSAVERSYLHHHQLP
jgi:hypothetical protein